MWRIAVCAFVTMILAAMSPAHAQSCPTAEDIPVLVDARLAALRTVLQLTPEQETLWPTVETAMRKFGKLRFALIYGVTDLQQQGPAVDVLHERASTMAAAADALTKLADAESALYQTLDNTQKRRFDIMTYGMMAANARTLRVCRR